MMEQESSPKIPLKDPGDSKEEKGRKKGALKQTLKLEQNASLRGFDMKKKMMDLLCSREDEERKKKSSKELKSEKGFEVGDEVVWYNSKSKEILGHMKLKRRGILMVKKVHLRGTLEVENSDGDLFITNGNHVKLFHPTVPKERDMIFLLNLRRMMEEKHMDGVLKCMEKTVDGARERPDEVMLQNRDLEKRRRVVEVENENLNEEGGSLNLQLGRQESLIELNDFDGKSGKKTKIGGVQSSRAVCQVKDCKADLSTAKDYHRRHKFESSCSYGFSYLLVVLIFSCRFHVLQEFDEGKRSCRMLLAGHNKRQSVMFERLSDNGKKYEEETREHINEYADVGLRTLILAYRELSEEEYTAFNEKNYEAKNSVSVDRQELIDEVTEEIEKEMILLGVTVVEDKLQQGVPECIDKLA
ncbi:hypothetical protein ACS0TY_008243 [Phlomoides rotata]